MKQVLYVLIAIVACSQVSADIQLQVCDPNTLEPLDLTEVMIGTDVSVVVSSDANDLWGGGLFIEGQARAVGQLTARDGDPNTPAFSGSCLTAAGEDAYIYQWKDSNLWGFDCYTDVFERTSGSWFVLDYTALEAGTCTVGFYDHDVSWTAADPNLSIDFLNTASRDLNDDEVVNLLDFSLFAADWDKQSDPNDPNLMRASDFSKNGHVGLEDVVMFADFWLWGVDGWKPAEEVVSASEPNIVYDVTYSLVCDPNASPFTDPNTLSDANSLSDITLGVGDSVVIYIDKSSVNDAEVMIFNMDVTISDPNLGSIDNDPNGTAEIFAWPRMTPFDFIGPGAQSEGIGFFAANLTAMDDGDMAGFVYTADQVGDVTLGLVDYADDPPAILQTMTIHQVQPVVELLQQAYDESSDLQQSVSQTEWDAFIESVEESTQQ